MNNTKQLLKRMYLFGVVSFLFCHSIQAQSWSIPVTVTNGTGVSDMVHFGIHPDGTYGLDEQLGEVNLPPLPPPSVFETRFLITGYEGFALDIRDTSQTERIHVLKWQAGSGGYPITVEWDPEILPPGEFAISDAFGGVFIPPLNMKQNNMITIPADQYFLTRLHITLTPFAGPLPPVLQGVEDQTVFSGQQFARINLNEIVSDPDTPNELLSWSAQPEDPLISFLIDNNLLQVNYPSGWVGSKYVLLEVQDPEGNTDTTSVLFTCREPGLIEWLIPIEMKDAGDESGIAYFGISPEATNGIDPQLGEQNLPPIPPVGIYDLRFELSLFASSVIDVRENTSDTKTHHLKWQTGQGGYPVTLTWDDDLPEGDFIMQDDMGGVFIPPFSMKNQNQLIIPESLDMVTGVEIQLSPVIDTVFQLGPDSLWFDTYTTSTVSLEWTMGMDQYFDYYEILYDTTPFYSESTWVWDKNMDPGMAFQSTTSAMFDLPEGRTIYFRIRAWDTFGNVSVPSNICSLIILSPGFFNLKVLLEGPSQGVQMNTSLNEGGYLPLSQPYNTAPWNYYGTETVTAIPDTGVVDWVLVELRDSPDASSAFSATTLKRQAAFVMNDGSVKSIDGISLIQFDTVLQYSLFVVIRHRNHLAIMSASQPDEVNDIFCYDYSSDEWQVFGGANGHKEIAPGVWGMIGGDANGDGTINEADRLESWYPVAGKTGYYGGDVNMDSQVNNRDKNDVWYLNFGKSEILP